MLILGLMQRTTNREQRLARAGLAVTGDHLDAVVEQRVHKELLFQIAGAHRDAAGSLHEIRQLQAAHETIAVMAGRHRLTLIRAQQNVFVQVERLRRGLHELKYTLRTKALHFIDTDRDLAVAGLFVNLRHLVVEIVLRFQSNRPGLELHIDILRDEDRGRGKLLLHKQRCGDDAVVLFAEVGEDRPQANHGRGGAGRIHQIRIDDHGKRAAVGQLDPFVHGPGIRQ